MDNKEFKIKDLNNMTDEEILWALKKVPRNEMDAHTKTLFIGAIESLKKKVDDKKIQIALDNPNESLMQINGITCPKLKLDVRYNPCIYEVVDAEGKDVKIIYNETSNKYEITDGKCYKGSFIRKDKFAPVAFKTEYATCKELKNKGIDLFTVNNLFQTCVKECAQKYSLVECFEVGIDKNTNQKVYNIVWERDDYIRVGIYTNTYIGFDIRSEELTVTELQAYLMVANYLKEFYKA